MLPARTPAIVPVDDRSAVRIDRRPLPGVVAEAIEEMVAARGLRAGDRLPSEAELARLLGVGRSSVRDALAQLERSGVVHRRWGIGTVVAAGVPAIGLEVLESLEALAARQGWVCRTADLHIEARRADAVQARRLHIEVGEPVTVIERTKLRRRTPVAHMTGVVAERVVPYTELVAGFDGSITEFLRARTDEPMHSSRTELTAANAGRTLAARLSIPRGSPLLVLDEELLGLRGEVLAWDFLHVVPGAIKVEIFRRA
jgi:GntR family transcriptional regulator